MANEFVVKNGLITPTVQLPGATSGTVTLSAPAVAGTTTIALPATAGTIVTTGDTGTVTNTMLAGSIANDKLVNNTISGTALGGTLPTATFNVSGVGLSGSATYNGTTASTFTVTSNATSANTVSTIVSRDASGNFSAGTITAALNGNASTASTLQTARTITLSGDVAGSVSFNGSTNVTITTTIQPDSVALGTDTTGNYVATVAVSGTGLSVSGSGVENAAVTVTSNATNANTASTIVARDASGNFSAGTITAALSGNASTASALQTARTISLTGDVTGSVSFDGSGNAAIATTIQPDSVALGTDTTGNYMVNVAAGTGVSVSHTQGEGSTATVSIGQAVGTTDNVTFNNVTVNGTLNSDDITSTNISVSGNATITGNLTVSGTTTTVNSTTISIADANIELARNATTAAQANGAGLTVTGPTTAATLTYTSADDRWNFNKNLNVGTVFGALSGNASTATTLQTARTINGVSFDGSANISFNTSSVSEGTNLYYTDARARAAHSFAAGSGAYNSSTGVITIPTNTNQLTNGAGFITGYTETDTLATVTGRGATTSGAITISSGTTDQGLTMTVSDSSWNYIGFNHGATRKAYFGINGSGNPEWGSDSGALTITGNYTTIGTSTRSPIFYDSDNTSYYGDFASTSYLNALTTAGVVTFNGSIYFGDTSNTITTSDDYSSPVIFQRSSNSGKGAIVIRGSDSIGTAIEQGRSNAASHWGTYLAFLVHDDNTSDVVKSLKEKLRINATGVGIGTTSPALNSGYVGLDVVNAGYTQIRARSTASSAGIEFKPSTGASWEMQGTNNNTFILYDRTNSVYRTTWTGGNVNIGWNNDTDQGYRLSINGTGYAVNDFRSPIFYDSNNTGFYVDPNSTSNLQNLTVNNSFTAYAPGSSSAWNSLTFYSSTEWGDGTSYGVLGGESGDGIMLRRPHIVWNADQASADIRLGRSGGVSGGQWINFGIKGSNVGFIGVENTNVLTFSGASSRITAVNGVDAPIFYDSNDTNYYTDPASTSVINALTVSTINNIKPKTDVWHQSNEGKERFYFAPNSTTYYRTGFNFVFRNNSDSGVLTIDGSGNLRTTTGGDNYASHSLHVGGTGFATSDFRAPIFYDSNDTNYYVDPTSTTKLTWLEILGGANNANSDAALYISQTSNADWGISLSKASYEYGIVYNLASSHTYGIRGLKNGTEYLRAGTDQLYHSASVRSPIFYDSDNTAYYADPASTSIFNQLTVDGDPVRTATHSGSDFVNGTLVQTDIDSSGWSGASFRLEATGKSYGAGIPFMFMAEGYLYADTIINYNGVHLGHNGFSTMKIFNNNGTLAFWWPRVSYWNSFEVRVIDAGGSSHNRVTSITDVAEPSGATVTKKVTVNMAYYMRGDTSSSNADTIRSVNFRASNAYYLGENNWFLNNTNGGWYSNVRIQSADDMRAPIFYDSNDTGYYFDGASTTRTNIIQTNYIGVNQAYNSSWPLIVNGNAYLNGGGYGQAEGSWRAPIFYDSNNTGYYTDPASTSVMNTINLGQVNAADGNFLFTWGSASGTTRHLNLSSYGGDPSQAHTGQSGITWGYRSDSQAYYMIHLTHGDYSGHTKLTLSWHTGIRIGAAPEYGGTAFYNNSLNTSPSLIFSVGRGDGNVRVTNDIRSPIYYDLNDTNYYADPNSTSRFSSIRADNWFRPEGETGLYSYSYAQHFYPDSGGFYWESDGPIRIRDGYEGAIKGYVGYHDSTGFGLLSNGGGWWLNTPNNNLYLVLGGNSDQTPYGNAGAKLMFCGGSSDAQENYYIGTNFENFGGNYAKLDLRWHTGIRIGAQPGYGGVRIYDSEDMGTIRFSVNKGDAHTRVESGDFYAANLIDRDDTNYYLNPNGTSRLVAIDTTGGTYNVFRTWTDLPGHHGFYSSVHNGAHLRPNDGSYGSWRIDGSRGGWCGIEFAGLSNGNVTMMVNPDSNTSGFHNNSYGWQMRWNNGTGYIHKNAYGGGTAATIWDSSNLTNLNQLTNGPGYLTVLTFDGLTAKTAGTGTYTTTGDFRAPIFYNHTDTGYYVDPDSLSVMNRISLGYNSGENNSIGCSNWFRSSGSTGWYNASYAGGIYMEDSTWVRVYNNKQFYAANYIQSDSSVRAPIFYESANTAWYVDPGSNSLLSGNLSVGTTFNPSVRLHVRQISSSTTTIDSGISVLNDAGTQGCAAGIRFSTYAGEDGGSYAKQYIGGVRSASGAGHGPLVFCNRNAADASIVTLSDERMRIDPTGFVQASVDFRSPIYYDSGNTAYYVDAAAAGTSVNVAGSIIAAGNVTAYSDIRLKTNIRTIDNAIDKIKKIRGVTFDRTDNPDLPRQAGVIAQEVKEVLPEVVSGSEESKYTVAYGNMVGLLIEAIKEQQSEIDELKALVRQLLAK